MGKEVRDIICALETLMHKTQSHGEMDLPLVMASELSRQRKIRQSMNTFGDPATLAHVENETMSRMRMRKADTKRDAAPSVRQMSAFVKHSEPIWKATSEYKRDHYKRNTGILPLLTKHPGQGRAKAKRRQRKTEYSARRK